MTSAKLALARGKWHTAGEVIFDGVKALSSNPQSKRDPKVFRENGILTTRPYEKGDQLDTTPYDKTFAQASHEENNWGETPDGDIQLDIIGMLNG